MNKKYLLLAVLVLYIAGIVVVASLDKVPAIASTGINDKLFHFAEFFVLAILSYETLKAFNVKNRRVFIALGTLLFALLTEFIQLRIESRSFSLGDIAADIAGGLIALVIAWKS